MQWRGLLAYQQSEIFFIYFNNKNINMYAHVITYITIYNLKPIY